MNGKTTAVFVVAALSTIATVLWLDRPGLVHQLILGGGVCVLLGFVFVRHPELRRETLIAIAIATTGEVILSIGLGIYGYRSGGVPLYVPPGHGVVYLLALQSSRHLHRFEQLIVTTTFLAGSIVAAIAAVVFADTFGLACWAVTLLIAAISPRRLLIATCIAFTSVLEIAGTWAGNWTWHESQGLLSSGNPPVGVVLLYCCLDLLTLMALGAMTTPRRRALVAVNSDGDLATAEYGPQFAGSALWDHRDGIARAAAE